MNNIEAKARAVNIWLRTEVGTLCDEAVSVYAACGRAGVCPDDHLQELNLILFDSR